MNVRRDVFVSKQQHKIALLREILVVEPFTHKVGSRERGNAGSLIAENSNRSEYEFIVSMRSVPEKFGKLYEDWLHTEREERTASGIEGTADDEFDQAMQDNHERLEDVKEEWNKEFKKAEKEKNKPEDIRKIVTERIRQTKKRHMSDLIVMMMVIMMKNYLDERNVLASQESLTLGN